MFENIYGLSCVENQVLAVLKNEGTDLTYFYNNCAVNLKELFCFMVLKGMTPEYFDILPRIHKAAADMGILYLKHFSESNLQTVINKVQKNNQNEHLLIRVNKDFTKNELRARGFRQDHFVYLRKFEDKYELINDIPEKKMQMDLEKLKNIYDGEYLEFKVLRELTSEDQKILWKKRKFKPEKFQKFEFYPKDIERVPDIGVKLRNMAGVYKTLRFRLFDYYGKYTDTNFVKEELINIEKHYSLFEYYNLKKYTSASKYYPILCEINETETKIMTNIKKQLEEK